MPTADDFEVAKAVADQLRDLDRDRQVRILKWVSESLGVVLPSEQVTLAAAGQRPASDTRRSSAPGASPNIKSFIESKEPKSDNQFAAAVAYFYRFEAPQNERQDSITPEKLQEATRLSGRNRLGDPGKTLRNAKDMGYLDTAARGEFQINSVGENLVAMTLPSQRRVGNSRASKKPGRLKKQKH